MGSKRCINCGQSITATFTADDGYIVWAHENKHTVCDWREDMEPTSRVATPIEVLRATDRRCCYCGAVERLTNIAARCTNGFPHCFLFDMAKLRASVEVR